MENNHSSAPPPLASAPFELRDALRLRVVGQDQVIEAVAPYVRMFQAGLAPEDRPTGSFLLLGPTGTGKTRTVEALADVLHGSEKHILKIDCGEFQMEHEVAKLIGAPPGYLGHRETPPMLSQQRLTAATSEGCKLALVLFDEIEKAAPSLSRLLLGVLDKATLRLGDNTTVNFEDSLIFFTSNLGSAAMMKVLSPDFGFQASAGADENKLTQKLTEIGLTAVRKKFSPEFVNRLDVIATYQPLSDEALHQIVQHQLDHLQRHIEKKLQSRAFLLDIGAEARNYLRRKGTSKEYGARELKRLILREITQPIANLLASGYVQSGQRVAVEFDKDKDALSITCHGPRQEHARPRVLIVEDNLDLLLFLERSLHGCGWDLVTAQTVLQAQDLVIAHDFDAAIIDYLLPDGNGVDLCRRLRRKNGMTPLIVMSGINLASRHEAFCHEASIHLLRKPFLPHEVVRLLKIRLAEAHLAA